MFSILVLYIKHIIMEHVAVIYLNPSPPILLTRTIFPGIQSWSYNGEMCCHGQLSPERRVAADVYRLQTSHIYSTKVSGAGANFCLSSFFSCFLLCTTQKHNGFCVFRGSIHSRVSPARWSEVNPLTPAAKELFKKGECAATVSLTVCLDLCCFSEPLLRLCHIYSAAPGEGVASLLPSLTLLLGSQDASHMGHTAQELCVVFPHFRHPYLNQHSISIALYWVV